jgi:asparagine synthase (glutamine-hydrolysing)
VTLGRSEIIRVIHSTDRMPSVGVAIWASPGSLPVDQVAEAWTRRQSLSLLATISGPWGVVLWDPDSSEHLIVRDPVGVQPLYWARTDRGQIAVSSWLDRLLDEPDVDDALDYEGVLLDSVYALHGETTATRTRFAAVSRVPSGHAVRIRPDGSTRLEQYWNPRDLPGPDRSLSLQDAAELLRERVDTAVRRLTPLDAPTAGHVSGGLDCTSITCRANQVLAESNRSLVAGYSWAPDEQHLPRFDGDERSLLDDVAAQESMRIERVTDDGSGDWFFDLDQDRYRQTTHAWERFVLPRAKAEGVQVMLTGWGGDELASFNGRGVLPHLVRRGNLRAVWKQLGGRLELLSDQPVGLRQQTRSLAATVLDATPDWFPHPVPRQRRQRHEQQAALRAKDEALRSVSDLAADALAESNRTYGAVRDHHDYQLALLTAGHLQRRCEGWYQTGELFDVTYRYPLLDLDVVTAALSLPWWAFMSDGWTRTAFRLAVDPWVPDSIAWNVTKHEPALFSPARRAAEPPPAAAAQPWRADDEQYQRMLDVARTVNFSGRGDARTPRPVFARTDAAPRTN